jgi:hypothetical protein
MNFFKRLFGKSDKQQDTYGYEEQAPITEGPEMLEKTVFPDADPEPEEQAEIPAPAALPDPRTVNTTERFKTELYESLNRYYSAPELRVELNLKDAAGNSYAEHEAFNSTFEEWQGIRSGWDRRSVLYSLWDQSEFDKLQKWQVVERFVKDRSALDAVEYQKAHISNDDFQDIRVILALSKLYRVLDSPPTALRYAKGAYELRPDLDIVKVEYANVLHLSDTHEDRELAHRLINEVLTEKIAAAGTEAEIPLLNFFLFAPGYIDSSVFAVNFLQAGHCNAETWATVAEEYYWCPVFRYEHAVNLSQGGETLKALAKLNALADEFPWYKTGVTAAMSAIEQLREQSGQADFMDTEMTRMQQYQSMW